MNAVSLKDYDDKKGKIPRHKQASSRDDMFETPDYVYSGVCNEHHIICNLDPFASNWNEGDKIKTNSKCDNWFTYEMNALNLEYLIPDGKPTDKKPSGVWLNHPHSLHKEVLKHNLQQWQKHNLDMIMIIPANTVRPPYWAKNIQRYIHAGIEVTPLVLPNPEKNFEVNGYMNFKKHGGDTEFDSRNGYLVVRYYSKNSLTYILKKKLREYRSLKT